VRATPSSGAAGAVLLWAIRGAFVVASALVVWQSLVPPDSIAVTGPSDKVMHLVGYGVLGLLAALSRFPIPQVLVWLAVSALGAVVEVLQSRTPQRSFEVLDICADALGAGLGVILGVLVLRLARARRSAIVA
jgi:VanZ family protein